MLWSKVDPYRLFPPVLLAMWAALLAYKAWLVPNMSFHWDEFWFLSLVHAGLRGELSSGFQMLHVLLFAFLPGQGDEINQLRIARWIMWALLALSSWLLFLLARRWCGWQAALLAPVAFLSATPVLVHGASFRTDSLVLPLSLGILLALSSSGRHDRHLLAAGAMWGLAAAVSVKAVMLAPVAACVWLAAGWPGWTKGIRCLSLVGASALVSWGLVALVQQELMTLAPAASSMPELVVASGEKVFSSWMPRQKVFLSIVHRDRLFWSILALAWLVALARRPVLSGMALSLLPVLLYRNAFEYYYVLMLAPVCVLVAVLGQELLDWGKARSLRHPSRAHANTRRSHWALVGITFGLYCVASNNMTRLSHAQNQDRQAQVVRAVHAIFPNPVPYIDHSGVIASFPKQNFFMSTWGMEDYKARNKPFMPDLLATTRPPFMLGDRLILTPGQWLHKKLLPLDQQQIASTYIPYWGPIWVAGAQLGNGSQIVHLPFAANYRLDADGVVMINGIARAPGEIISVSPSQVVNGMQVENFHAAGSARLVWAQAHLPPAEDPPSSQFFALPW